MIKVASGIKIGTSVGPGPESRLMPTRQDVVPHEVKNKKKPAGASVPQVPGVEYIAPIPG